MEQINKLLQTNNNLNIFKKEENNSIPKNTKNIPTINDLKYKDLYISRSTKINDLRYLIKIPKYNNLIQNAFINKLNKHCLQTDCKNKFNIKTSNSSLIIPNMSQNNDEKQPNNISRINLHIMNLIKGENSHYIKRNNDNYIIGPNILLDNYNKFKFKFLKQHNSINLNKDNKESVEWILLHKKKEKNKREMFTKPYKMKEQKPITVPEITTRKSIYKKADSEREKTPNIIKEDKQKINIKQLFSKTQKKAFKDFSLSNTISEKTISDRNRILKKDNPKKIINKKLFSFDVLSVAGRNNGREKINQDCFMIIPSINECKNVKVFGVFDGHGDYGEILSKEVKENIKELFCNKNVYGFNCENNTIDDEVSINNNENIPAKILIKIKMKKRKNKAMSVDKLKRTTIKKFHLNIKANKNLLPNKAKLIPKKIIHDNTEQNNILTSIYNKLSKNNYLEIYDNFKLINSKLHNKYQNNDICHGNGVTLSLIFLFNSLSSPLNKLITVNLGDTKSILITDNKQIKELTTVHTPSLPTERTRIENFGGIISRIDCSITGPLRVWGLDRKTPGLSITRSFGDFDAESLGVISIPDVNEYDIEEEKTKIVVIGTNGVWEFLTNEKIMDIVLPYYDNNDCNGAIKKIKETAWKLWEIKNPKGIPDITVIVLFFK